MTRAAVATTQSERWPAQGEWTYEDYARLPDDGWRYEIIRGVLHVSPAPSYRHQSIVGNLLFLFRLFLRDHPVARVVPAPVDVVLPGIASPVQPDLVVVVVERLDSIVDERVEGAPDLLVEVLSPSNWLSDRREKYAAYAQAGVREYWIVEPREETVEVFVLSRGSYNLLGKYGPQDRVRSEVLAGFEPAVDDVFDG
jgi:Uma2 family endonuclease